LHPFSVPAAAYFSSALGRPLAPSTALSILCNSLTSPEFCLIIASTRRVAFMPDPLPTAPVPGPMSEADRDARIEQLLLSGLDQYFAGRYERAINIWTRVAFLERGHGRARAYIERARGALAERQRETDELVHAGVAAYHAGELQAARDLLTRATNAGGSSDTAMLFIERLRRVDAASDVPVAAVADGPVVPPMPEPAGRTPPWRWFSTIAASVTVATAILLGSLRIASWLAELPIDAPVSPSAIAEPLPLVTAADLRIAQARELFTNGRAGEALRTLEAIDVGDPRHRDADRLRGEIQRIVLDLEPLDAGLR